MAKNEEPTVSMDALAEAFSAAMKSVQPKAEPKEGDEEYTKRLHAEGFYDDFFGKKVYQNAYEAQARGLSEETRRRVSQLKTGSYIKNRVKVQVENDGEVIRLMYPVSGDNMLLNKDYFRSFSELIDKIWDEMHVGAVA